jgi:hypothetical protein
MRKWYSVFPAAAAVVLAAACSETTGTVSPTVPSRLQPRSASADIAWTGNGTTEGVCNRFQGDTKLTPGAGEQGWLFILTSPGSGPWTLSAVFDPATTPSPATANGVLKGNGAVQFVVYSAADAKLVSAEVQGGTNGSSVLTVSHCSKGDEPPPPQAALAVTKTADGSFRRTWTWQIDKTVSPTAVSVPVNTPKVTAAYSVVLSATSADDDFKVSGTITISNSGTAAAYITSLTDALSNPVANVTPSTCTGGVIPSASTPVLIAAGGTITCDYSQALTAAASGTNTATITATDVDGDNLPVDPGTDDYSFASAANVEVNRCVTLTDNKYNSAPFDGTPICANADGTAYSNTFAYSQDFGPFAANACGPNVFTNVAKVWSTAQVPAELDNDDATLTVAVICQGCTPGYWKSNTGGWAATGIATGDLLSSIKVFGPGNTTSAPWNVSVAGLTYTLSGKNLGAYRAIDGLGFQGNSTLEGKAEILLRAGTAALLNASWTSGGKQFAYPLNATQVRQAVVNALNAPGTAADGYSALTGAATTLDRYNNLGCPLNAKGLWIAP